MGLFINLSKATFMYGRYLGDNVILVTKFINGHGRKKLFPIFMIMIDLKKAYDSIEWCFI